jgi:hypothetical protein
MAANGPLAVRALEPRLRLADQLEAALDAESRSQAESHASTDFAEGLAAAAARRTPVLHGGVSAVVERGKGGAIEAWPGNLSQRNKG